LKIIVVLTEKTASPKSGKFLEILGNYNPRLKQIDLKKERLKYWLSQGAQVSETVHNLLVGQEVIKGPKIKKKIGVSKKKKEIKKEKKEEKKEISQPTKETKGKVKKETKEKKEIPAKGESPPKADAPLERASEEKEEKDTPALDKSKEKSKIEKE